MQRLPGGGRRAGGGIREDVGQGDSVLLCGHRTNTHHGDTETQRTSTEHDGLRSLRDLESCSSIGDGPFPRQKAGVRRFTIRLCETAIPSVSSAAGSEVSRAGGRLFGEHGDWLVPETTPEGRSSVPPCLRGGRYAVEVELNAPDRPRKALTTGPGCRRNLPSSGRARDQAAAGRLPPREGDVTRKVRPPQGRVVGNANRERSQGKCHRKHTACPPSGGPVRVKRRGKSSPRLRRRRRHGKPHPEQAGIGGEATPWAAMIPG